jgi:transcription elongation factor GreA
MKDDREHLTQEKYDQFKAELQELVSVRRKEVAEQLEHAKGLGDLSENAEYHEARDMQAAVEDRIRKLEHIIKSAVIVSSHTTDSVSIGATVTVKRKGANGEQRYTIVSSEEADTAAGKISVRSPLGAAAFGKKKGESFTFETPVGTATCEILSIE